MEIHTHKEKEMGLWTKFLHPPTLPPTFYFLPHLPKRGPRNQVLIYLQSSTACPTATDKDPKLCCSLLYPLTSHQEPSYHALIYLYTRRHCHLRPIISYDLHASCHGSLSAELNQKNTLGTGFIPLDGPRHRRAT